MSVWEQHGNKNILTKQSTTTLVPIVPAVPTVLSPPELETARNHKKAHHLASRQPADSLRGLFWGFFDNSNSQNPYCISDSWHNSSAAAPPNTPKALVSQGLFFRRLFSRPFPRHGLIGRRRNRPACAPPLRRPPIRLRYPSVTPHTALPGLRVVGSRHARAQHSG